MNFQCSLTRFSPSFETVRIYFRISGLVVVGAHTIAPTARGRGFLYFFRVLCGLVLVLVRQWQLAVAGNMAVLLMPKLSAASAPRTPTSAPALCLSSGFLLIFTGEVRRSSQSAQNLPDDALASCCYVWPVPASLCK